MRTTRSYVVFYVLFALVSLMGGLFALITLVHLPTELQQIIWIITGSLFATALMTVSALLHGGREQVFVEINVDRLKGKLEEIQNVEVVEVAPHEIWEPSSESLLVQDPALALAKIRIDIERELRRISIENDILQANHRAHLGWMLRNLEQRGVLPSPVFSAIGDVLPLCNAASHGEDISINDARLVVELGEDIIRVLRASSSHQKKSETSIPVP